MSQNHLEPQNHERNRLCVVRGSPLRGENHRTTTPNHLVQVVLAILLLLPKGFVLCMAFILNGA